MRDRIYLVPPPTSLDVHSIARSNYQTPSCPCSHRTPARSTPWLASESHPPPRPDDTLRCKRSLVVLEYQPDVHRLRRSPST